jgi:hypothetical protein
VAPQQLPGSLMAAFSHLAPASQQVLALLRWLVTPACGAQLWERGL